MRKNRAILWFYSVLLSWQAIGKKEDRRLGSILIRLGYGNLVLDERRFYEIKAKKLSLIAAFSDQV